MNNKYKIDILMPTYNGAEYLCDQLNSILAQTYRNWHLIIRDDGSTDGTVEILKQFAKDWPDHFTLYLDSENIGVCRSFSELLCISNSDYIMFSDQDDIWLEDKVSVFMEEMLVIEAEDHNSLPVLIHSDLTVVDERLNIVSDSMWAYQALNPFKMDKIETLLIQNHVSGCVMLINRKLADICSPIPHGAIMHDWWLALVAVTCGRLIAIPQQTVMYRQHSGNNIGAKKWGAGHVIRSMPLIPTMFGSLEITGRQAEGLLPLEKSFLDHEKFQKVSAYVDLFNRGWLSRKVTVIRLGIRKYGFIRNIAMFLFI